MYRILAVCLFLTVTSVKAQDYDGAEDQTPMYEDAEDDCDPGK